MSSIKSGDPLSTRGNGQDAPKENGRSGASCGVGTAWPPEVIRGQGPAETRTERSAYPFRVGSLGTGWFLLESWWHWQGLSDLEGPLPGAWQSSSQF